MQSENIDRLAEALARAQGQIKNPIKNKKVTVTTRTGGRYEFEYADLTAIIDAIKKPLADNELSYVQYVEQQEVDGKFRLVTKLLHSSGQWLGSVSPLFLEQTDRDGNPLPPTSQSFGSAKTFMKRYALAALLGVAADSDDDANAAEGNEAQVSGRKPKAPPPSAIKPAAPVATKRIDPHALDVPSDGKWIEWGRTFLETMQAAPEDDRTLWLMLNTESLRALSKEAPKVFGRLKTALTNLGIDSDILAKLGQHEDNDGGRTQNNPAAPQS
jgi:hypothetical protein